VGLLSGLVLLPLAPVRGVAWVAEVLAEEADRQLEEQQSPQRRLAELDVLRASGRITDEDAARMEADIIDAMLAREA